MRKFGLLILLSVIGIFYTYSQEPASQENEQKIEKRIREVQDYKMKFLAQQMSLSELQKKKFFEVYEEMSESKRECYKDAMGLERKLKHSKDATEADYQQATEAMNKANSEWAEKEKQYNEKLSEFLSQKQIYQMREAENQFRTKFEEMKHARKRDGFKKSDHHNNR